MIESLRRWGGSLANAPLIAVTPRAGPRIGATTHASFEKHEVRYVRESTSSRYAWFRFYNKPLAVAAADAIAATDTIGWLDSDILFVGDPELLRLAEGEDFAACASDKEMGSSGPADPFDRIWRANCEALGIDLEALPWVETEREKVRIRRYWNGGVFVYRRQSGFGNHYLETCTRLLDARNRLDVEAFSIGIFEMSAITLAAHRLGLKWRSLPFSHNSIMGSRSHHQWYREEQLREARIVHYHDAMWPWFWETFLACLKATHPEVEEWLREVGPMRNEATLPRRLWARALRSMREREERKYIASCRSV
jgi:lipopolysaccharide biosynthesis glycosyltransferase